MLPLVHDFEGERVLVFGGGSVGARKARHFSTEAEVVVLSPEFVDQSFGGAERVRAAPAPEDVAGWLDTVEPALVVAATDNEALNTAIETAAQERGVLSNRADTSGERAAGSVVVPATIRSDPVTVAISTGGQSPALSRYLRVQMEGAIENAGGMAELTGSLRSELAADGVDPETRRRAIRAIVRDDDVWKALDTGSANPRQIARDVISEITGDEP